MKKFASVMLILSITLLSLNGCGEETQQEEKPYAKKKFEVEVPETAEAAPFAKWKDIKVSYTPNVPEYSIESDLSNVKYVEEVYVPPFARDTLAKNGFVVTEGYDNEYFSLYEDNRYNMYPSFVTTDSVLHTYHLYFNYLLKSLEENELYDLAVEISKDMLDISMDQYETLKTTEWQYAAKRNVAFFAVPIAILDDDFEIPKLVEDEVEAELALMEAHEGIAPSPVIEIGDFFEYNEDYSQYVPRGHYTKSEKLKDYFKALMWYGRMTFRAKNGDETRSALLMVEALNNNEEIRNNWKRLYEPIGFFVGDADDLVYLDYTALANEIFEKGFTYDELPDLVEEVSIFSDKVNDLRDPGINSLPVLGTIFDPDSGVEERTEQVKGFRFLGQRFTIDAFVFQKLICREVGNKDGTMPCPKGDLSRMLPKGLDIPSAFGDMIAQEILHNMGETEYARYSENMTELNKKIDEIPEDLWTKNLYWGWLKTLRNFKKQYNQNYPMFMQTEAWDRKELVTFLGSWAELKHDTILYAKQVYAELGGGPMIEDMDDRGYVEPNPELYASLAGLVQLTMDGLNERAILSSKNEVELEKLYDLLIELKDISIKELENKPLSDEDYELIRNYGGSLEHFWYETFTDEEKENGNLLNDNPAPIIADVATDPNGWVLEVGTGYIDPIYVVFELDGELRVAKGGVYSYYEFPWPMSDRLTDEKWRDDVLNDYENPPERPQWTDVYFEKYVYEE